MQSPKQEARRATLLMIFAVVSSLIVIAILVGLLVAVGGLITRLGQPVRDFGPYDLGARRIPLVGFVGDLLPQTLGDFTRLNLTHKAPDKGSVQDGESEYGTEAGSFRS